MANQFPYYDISFKIDNKDYGLNVQSVYIIGSIFAVFQTVIIQCRIDSQDIISREIYGKKSATLSIVQMTEDIQEQDSQEIELYVLKVLGGNTQRTEQDQHHPLQDKTTFVCVPKKPWEYMTMPVNYLAQNTSQKSPYEAVNEMVDKFLSGVKKDVKDKNANKYKGEQLPIPPMNFAAAVDYLDERYGVFKGPLFYTCQFEENTFYMWDLSQRISDPEDYKIYTLATGKKEKKEIYEESGKKDDTFYTYSNIVFKTSGNQTVAGDCFEHQFMMKPRDGLYKITTVTAQDVYDKNLPKDGGTFQFHDDLKKNNTRFHLRGFVGVDDDDSALTTDLSKRFFIQSEATVRLDRNLRLKKLFHVGVPVSVLPEALNYEKFHGKYLVKGSEIKLIRDGVSQFKAICDIHLFRSNVLT